MYPPKNIRIQLDALAHAFSKSHIIIAKASEPWPHYLGPITTLPLQFSNTSYLCEGNQPVPFFMDALQDMDATLSYLIYVQIHEDESFKVSFRELRANF